VREGGWKPRDDEVRDEKRQGVRDTHEGPRDKERVRAEGCVRMRVERHARVYEKSKELEALRNIQEGPGAEKWARAKGRPRRSTGAQ